MATHNREQDYSAADVIDAFKGQTLGFDDVDVSAGGGVVDMPPSYGGLTWSDGWDIVKPSEENADDPKSGYFAGITSGDQVAFNGNAGRVDISAESFNLKSLELTAAWDKELYVQILAYRGDKPVFNQLFSITDQKPTLIGLDLHNITDIIFIPGHEKHDHKSGGSGPFMVFDDLKVSDVQSVDTKSPSQHIGPAYATRAVAGDDYLAAAHVDLLHHHLAIA